MKVFVLPLLAALVAVGELKTCGESENLSVFANFHGRIVGGTDVPNCKYIPWQVRLKIGNALCGGSIISPKHVLTAAHCVYRRRASEITVIFGGNDRLVANNTRKLSEIIMHEDYNPNNYDSDIAVLVLTEDIEFSECVKQVCLDDAKDPHDFADGSCIVSGWGTTEWRGRIAKILQMVRVSAHRGAYCKKTFGFTGNYMPSNETMLCAGAAGKDSCQGDSGGPLVCLADGQFVQVGVVSFGWKCAQKHFPGVYASVHHFRPWLDQIISGKNTSETDD